MRVSACALSPISSAAQFTLPFSLPRRVPPSLSPRHAMPRRALPFRVFLRVRQPTVTYGVLDRRLSPQAMRVSLGEERVRGDGVGDGERHEVVRELGRQDSHRNQHRRGGVSSVMCKQDDAPDPMVRNHSTSMFFTVLMIHSIICELLGRVQGYDVMQLITALLITSFPASPAANFACCCQKIIMYTILPCRYSL
jgi:hypothetical protein